MDQTTSGDHSADKYIQSIYLYIRATEKTIAQHLTINYSMLITSVEQFQSTRPSTGMEHGTPDWTKQCRAIFYGKINLEVRNVSKTNTKKEYTNSLEA